MARALSSASTPIRRSTGSAFHSSTAHSMPMASASHRAWRTSGPFSASLPAPKRCATLAVVASRVPFISRNTGTHSELPSATPARSRALTRPAITVSTKPIEV